MSNYVEKEQISWDNIKHDSELLAEKLKSEFDVLPKRILAVTRGGLIPAAIVTRSLGIKNIETIGLESYHDQNQLESISILKNASPEYLENSLIIDDLVDTGKTFAYLKGITKDCIFATLYAKPNGAEYSDCYVRTFPQGTWVDFPWEV